MGSYETVGNSLRTVLPKTSIVIRMIFDSNAFDAERPFASATQHLDEQTAAPGMVPDFSPNLDTLLAYSDPNDLMHQPATFQNMIGDAVAPMDRNARDDFDTSYREIPSENMNQYKLFQEGLTMAEGIPVLNSLLDLPVTQTPIVSYLDVNGNLYTPASDFENIDLQHQPLANTGLQVPDIHDANQNQNHEFRNDIISEGAFLHEISPEMGRHIYQDNGKLENPQQNASSNSDESSSDKEYKPEKGEWDEEDDSDDDDEGPHECNVVNRTKLLYRTPRSKTKPSSALSRKSSLSEERSVCYSLHRSSPSSSRFKAKELPEPQETHQARSSASSASSSARPRHRYYTRSRSQPSSTRGDSHREEVVPIRFKSVKLDGIDPKRTLRDGEGDGAGFLCWCNLAFGTEKSLEAHKKRSHPADESSDHQCEHCQQKFRNKTNRDRHVSTVHSGDQPYKCTGYSPCEARFNSRRSLANHKTRVHQEKSSQSRRAYQSNPQSKGKSGNNTLFKCDFCDYASPWKGNVDRHCNLKHFMQRKFTCQQCKFKCGTKHNLENHGLTCKKKRKNTRSQF